ncbi:Gx transporter family protein [Mycoplasmatota bacterium]|nr:Gx transporter family protein [Mycoplasmatota bacterium]
MGNKKDVEKLIFIALLVALSVVLGIVDTFLSSFVSAQGVRIGLANIVILTGLYYLNFRESLLLIILKSLLTGLLLGNPMIFSIGFSGTLLSFLIMYGLLHCAKKMVSLTGVSIAGGIGHNIGQVIALFFYWGITVVFSLFWLIPIGIGTGIFVGSVVSVLRGYLNKGQVFKSITQTEDNKITLEQLINEE